MRRIPFFTALAVLGAAGLCLFWTPNVRQAQAGGSADVRCSIQFNKELFITNTSVVDDCLRTTFGPCLGEPGVLRGAWTFKHLIEGVAGTTDPILLDRFVRNWLAHWDDAQSINGFDVPARQGMHDRILVPWEAASGGTVDPVLLDMARAPFRLLAIVYRPDLRAFPGYSGGASGGELRFVFGFLELNGNAPPTTLDRATVIFEFGLPADNCDEIRAWANDFHALGAFNSFGSAYKRALEAITNRVTAIGADPTKPNGSAINQIRTNELEFFGPEWELREFRLNSAVDVFPAPLDETTVAQTPDRDSINGFPRLRDYVNEFEAEILAGTNVVPLFYPDNSIPANHFRGGSSLNSIDFWAADGINNNEARHKFSLNTCNGCHGRETDTGFLQVFPREPNVESNLSAFLGPNPLVVLDPVTFEPRTLTERQNRINDFCRLLNDPCEILITIPRTNRVH